jgi:hypothetical protein
MPRTAKKDPNLRPGKPVKSASAAIEWDRLTSELENAHIQVATSHRALLSLAATIAADIAALGKWSKLRAHTSRTKRPAWSRSTRQARR